MWIGFPIESVNGSHGISKDLERFHIYESITDGKMDTYKTDTLEVIKMTFNCDPLASSGEEPPRG